MAFTRTTTINAAPGGDSTKQAVLDLNTDLTGAFGHLNTLDSTKLATATAGTTYAPIAKGVTNGDSHDHVGGDGAAIPLTSAVTGVLPIANGGTGSSTQNFVDLTSNQTIGGVKTFSSSFGIGTSSPAAKLEVYDASVNAAYVPNAPSTWAVAKVRNDQTTVTGTASGIAFAGRSTVTPAGIVAINTNTTGGVVGMGFLTVDSNIAFERMRLTSSGNVLVGTTTDDGVNKLQVAGGIAFAPSTTTTAPAAGGAGALPATPLGYATITINGTARKIAYYA